MTRCQAKRVSARGAVAVLSDDGRGQLLRHGWPGNVRELRNAIEPR